MLISAVGFMLGAGGSALVAKNMGEDKMALANPGFPFKCISYCQQYRHCDTGDIICTPGSCMAGCRRGTFGVLCAVWAYTIHGFHIYAISFLFVGFTIFGTSFFTALNNGLVSAIISFIRTLIFEVALVLALPALWGLDGIWWAVVIARGLSIIVTFTFMIGNRKKYQY